jgi:lipopolysaccharide transport system ATP-binding protein
VEAHGLGKRYRIGARLSRHDSLRDLVGHALASPARNLRRLRRLTDFADGDGADVTWALRDVSFTLGHGEVLGIVGRNGAGKSTLLKLLSRITEPTTGRAVLRGRVGSLLEVGTGFHPDLTGRENVYLNGAILGMDRRHIEERFEAIVEFAGVSRYIDTPVKRYSSGMYLRLAFAVAAHLEPEILVVDEVLAVGDAQFQNKCLGKMRSASEEGRTVLFVSHNLAAVRTLCTRALLLREGAVVADDAVHRVVSAYMADVSEARWLWRPAEEEPCGNESTVVTMIAATRPDGVVVDDLTTSVPFSIDVEFQVTHDQAFVGLTVVLYDAEHTCVFSSLSNRETAWYGRPMPKGRYRTRCAVPGDLLNAGWFTVDVNVFGKDFTDQRLLRDVLRLELQDSGNLRGDYYGAYLGVVRPALAWRTERIADPLT